VYPHVVHNQTESGHWQGSRINAAAVNAGALFCSSAGGVGSRYILAGEVEGEEDGEASSYTSGSALGDVSSESEACMHVDTVYDGVRSERELVEALLCNSCKQQCRSVDTLQQGL